MPLPVSEPAGVTDNTGYRHGPHARGYRAASIAVVIATHNRPQLLSERSLKSVADQIRRPDMLIVVDDSDSEVRRRNRNLVDGFKAADIKITYMENRRTPGAAGAWNTALDHLYAADPSAFVAILDDDDSWRPEYLQYCEDAVLERRLDMVAAGIVYHESDAPNGMLLDPPAMLVVDDLLIRNTHIQGSNMFVRLCKLLEAGGFDEAMASTTDRDICIRLADLGTVCYGALSKHHLVDHYAERDRLRMSTAGSAIKRTGLGYFFRKYRGRMSETGREAFMRRSRSLFGCDPSAELPSTTPSGQPVDLDIKGHLDLVVGAITSPDVTLVANLMNSLIDRFGSRDGVALSVVLLENSGGTEGSRKALRNTVERASHLGLAVTLKTLEQQAADGGYKISAAPGEQLNEQKSIGTSRTMLQRYLYLEASPRPEAVVWILDDDLSLEGLEYGDDGSIRVRNVDYVSGILKMRETGADVVLCQENGDSPVPAPGCIRTQLVDLYHNLHRITSMRPDDPYTNLSDENADSRRTRHDYYYDLSSRETGHLESPFWYETDGDRFPVGQVLGEMVSRLPDIMSGKQVFRPLVSDKQDGLEAAVPSIHRGPATLVFDVRALRNFPNAVAAVGGAEVRRSDMVWSLLNHFVGGRKIVQSHLPVCHIRKASVDPHAGAVGLLEDILGRSSPVHDSGGRLPSKMLQDIRGYALYSSLQEALAKRELLLKQERGEIRVGHLYFDEQEIRLMVESYRRHVRERVHVFEMNFVRIIGLLSALRRLCWPGPESGIWWLKSAEYAASAAGLQEFVESLESVYTYAHLDGFRRQVADGDDREVGSFFKDLYEIVNRYRAGTPLPAGMLRRDAVAYVKDEFSTGRLVYLGMGEEGVALTDGRLVYKYFHRWNPKDPDLQVSLLRSLAGRLPECGTLPPILEVRRAHGHVVVVYPYEAGTGYGGGRMDEVLALLRECRRAGIACRNIHPDNLLVTSSGLKFIDYGADIVSISDLEFNHMCRRAFLSCRFAFRTDLKSLMTRALVDTTIPELSGLEWFRNAFDPRGWDILLYHPMERLIAGLRPRSILDYGCGDGRLTRRLAKDGVKVVQYDPDPACVKKCIDRGGLAVCGGTDLLTHLRTESVRFDVVVCSMVLCTIADNQEFDDVLQDLRRFVADSGSVLIAVCNPFHLSTAFTELAEKHLPASFRYDETFCYDKTVAVSGNRRAEVHRSYATYRRAFIRAGLSIHGVREFGGTDTHSALPASEHVVFQIGRAPSGPSVSLLIKTCLMEWRTIEHLIRHQTAQLEMPLGFAEKVVVVDPSLGPFPRQYDRPNPEAHQAAMERLIRDGVVDRVVYAPLDPEIMRSTYRRWFGAESVEARSTNGQQIFVTLFGFDSCTGDYVLQMDCDLLIMRADRDHNYLAEMADVLRHDPHALFVSMNICRPDAVPYTFKDPTENWRVNVVGCMYDRRRLMSVLPVHNRLKEGHFTLAWHRSFDRLINSSSYRSYRGGNPETTFIHVPNSRKTNVNEWMEILEAVERGYVPDVQMGKVELVGSASDWAGPRRNEPFVFVICGRNVAPGRFKQCFQSLMAQRGAKWGAVVIDDASVNGFGDYAEMLLADHMDRVTLIHNKIQRGTAYNTWNAVTRVCINPETVIITLDADDALAGSHVLERVRAEYEDGADATVGSMLRLDKEASYLVNFDCPRRWDSNVWQHLRTFKKCLFDAIAVEDLQMDGKWLFLATDWAFMVPIIEMASSPRFIPDVLYLYRPAFPKDEDRRREESIIIGHILSRTPYAKLRRPRGSGL